MSWGSAGWRLSGRGRCRWFIRAWGLDCGYRLDFLVDEAVVVEVKAVDALAPIHTAQVMTYLKLGGWGLGLLLNFNVKVLREGIQRVRI